MTLLTTLLPIVHLYSNIRVKSIRDPDDNFWRNSILGQWPNQPIPRLVPIHPETIPFKVE